MIYDRVKENTINTRDYVLNIYLTLMTRDIYGTYLYIVDEALKEYLKIFFDQQ